MMRWAGSSLRIGGFALSPAALQLFNGAKNTLPDGDADNVAYQAKFVHPLGSSRSGMWPVMRNQ